MASIATNDSDKSDKWKKHVNNNIINGYDILTSTLNTIAVKDAHHDKLSEKDAYNVLPVMDTPKIKRSEDNIIVKDGKIIYNPKNPTFIPRLMNNIGSGENELGNLLFGKKNTTE